MTLSSLLTVQQAADALGVTPRRVLALIAAGRLPAERFGKAWAIQPKNLNLKRIKDRKPGRPTIKRGRRT